jgi:glycosyltransferase involved in cell wall biosynthesis
MYISTIICTHNPRDDYFPRVLEALRNQCLPKDQWELLIIDNGSRDSVACKWPIDWHPSARHIREDELGLTPARIRGIRESKGEYLVFVDDDNVLDSSYLSNGLNIASSKPWIGAFGGSCIGEFEKMPNPDTTFMLEQLAIREITSESWAHLPGTDALAYCPTGAGMVVSLVAARKYAELANLNPLRKILDRTGSSLMSAGDSDLALCACQLGLAVGLFPTLRLTHLIPAGRVAEDYLLRLAERMSYSHALLEFIWTGRLPNNKPMYRGRTDKALRKAKDMLMELEVYFMKKRFVFRRRFELARRRGLKAAYEKMNEMQRMDTVQ